ncbi:MAG: hypothetical protein IJJ20_09810 [Thermoguttaceae bacterium]|nr:hypothetical protein [Thermoguttaceae bacterium]
MRSFGIDRQTRPQRNGDFRGRFFPRPQNALWGAAAVLLSVLLSVSPVSAQSDSSEPFDPIKENGEYFTGWETPDLALVVTGLLDGYIEPCGCAGMDRMKGGLSRRADFLKGLRADGWPVMAIDAGLITAGYGFQEELKFDMAINAFYLMGYSAIGISQNELRFPAHYLLKYTVPPGPADESLFVSANIGVYDFLKLYTLPYKVIEQNGIRIGVTSVVDPAALTALDEKIKTKQPEERLNAILAALKKEDCDHLVLIVHGSEQFVEQLIADFADFDVIVTGDSPTTPPLEPKRTESGQLILEVGEKGKYAIVLGIYGDSVRYQRVALDSRYKQSGDVHLLMKEYQDVLRGIVEAKGFRGLNIMPVESPDKQAKGDYVGSAKCGSCHSDAYDIWRESRHSSAWKSLSSDPPTEHTANPPRDCDPDCVSCHVVGWNGTAHVPYIGGYENMKSTAHLANVGCESCHGPGSNHIQTELGNDAAAQVRMRESMLVGSNVKQVCYSCHDSDNSPNFEFDEYYEKIDHSEPADEE